MVLSQSSKISLPSSSPLTTSLLLEPTSLSLALVHSDSSLSLYPPLSSSSLPLKPLSSVPPPTSSSSFLLLRSGSDSRVLFLAASPHKGASQILLRIYILQKSNLFSRAQVVCNQKGVGFDSTYGVVFDVNHGVSVKIVGSVNYFAMYSVSSGRVWVFALKLIGDGDLVKLMRCATIECCRPVWSVGVSSAVLILGEDDGVRVFHLRQLVKGNAKKVKSSSSDKNGRLESKGLKLPNAVVCSENQSLSTACNGSLDAKIEKLSYLVKQKSMRCREDSDDVGSLFMTFNRRHTDGLILKTVSVQALSPNKFVILDSVGDLHMLSLSGESTRNQMIHFPQSMKVQKLAVLPDISSRNQSFWVSDGVHSVHMMSLCETEGAVSRVDGQNIEEKQIKISASQAIFCDEEVRDLVPLSGNTILILGRGIYAFVIR